MVPFLCFFLSSLPSLFFPPHPGAWAGWGGGPGRGGWAQPEQGADEWGEEGMEQGAGAPVLWVRKVSVQEQKWVRRSPVQVGGWPSPGCQAWGVDRKVLMCWGEPGRGRQSQAGWGGQAPAMKWDGDGMGDFLHTGGLIKYVNTQRQRRLSCSQMEKEVTHMKIEIEWILWLWIGIEDTSVSSWISTYTIIYKNRYKCLCVLWNTHTLVSLASSTEELENPRNSNISVAMNTSNINLALI